MRLAVADVETTLMRDGERPSTLFWGLAIDGDPEEYRSFATTAKFWNFLIRYPETLCVYSHHDYDMIQALVDGAPIKIHDVRGARILRSTIGKHEWRNSHALFPTSLKEILNACGFAKPSLDDIGARNRADTVDALSAFKLCDQKYEALWGVRCLGAQKLTAASCAFAAAQNVAGKLPIHRFDREYYRGGRVEAFRVFNCGSADLWDINSSYPYSFLDAPERDTLVIADVRVEGDGPSPLCEISADSDKLMFPAGRFRTAFWASSYERYIRPHGAVKEIRIEKAIPCDLSWICALKDTIRAAYDQRLGAKARGDGAFAYAAKIGLNSIYGRLGLKGSREIAVVASNVPEGEDVTYYRLPGGRFLTFKEIFSKTAANYLFAGFVTCNARARLYDGIMRAQGECFYCDTDSVYLKAGTEFPMAKGPGCGQWKYEGTDTLSVESVKDYTFGSKNVRKGGADQFQWTIRRAVAGKSVAQVVKERRSTYDKRDVLYDGSTVPVYREDW